MQVTNKAKNVICYSGFNDVASATLGSSTITGDNLLFSPFFLKTKWAVLYSIHHSHGTCLPFIKIRYNGPSEQLAREAVRWGHRNSQSS